MTRGRFWLAQAVLAAMVAWSAWLVYRQAASVGGGFELDALWLIAAFSIKAATVWISALKFRELSRLVGLRLPPKEWFGLSVIPTFHSYLSPAQTGHLLRAVYLRNRYAFEYKRYGASIAAATLLETTIAALIGLGLTIHLLSGTDSLSVLFATALVGLCAVPVSFVAVSRLRPTGGGQLARFAEWASRYVNAVGSKPVPCLRLTVLCGASVLARWAGLYASFRTCGFDVDPMAVLVAESARTVGGIVSVTPSNIGVAEGIIAGSAALLGIPASESLPAAVVSRLLAMVLYIVPGIWFTKALTGTVLVRAGSTMALAKADGKRETPSP
jgi:uncharacterized membrane protein YbhN (UPF0104 family)